MGLFDKMKNVLGGKKGDGIEGETKAPSQVLRDAGIDPAGLKFKFGSDGSITVNGTIADEADRAKVNELLAGIPGVQKVTDNTTVAVAAPPEPETEPEVEPAGTESAEAETTAPEPAAEEAKPTEAQTYTVKSGDTLWKIASHFYGDGSKYPKIFEANKDVLDDPDRIMPGQELRIPEA